MIAVPPRLAEFHATFGGAAGRRWIEDLPGIVERRLAAWELTVDGPVRHGMVALVLPVVRPGGEAAVVKFQRVDEETAGEAVALRSWAGQGAVRLLDEAPGEGTLLLERLDGGRSLADLPDAEEAVRIIAGLLARLHGCPAPPAVRRLGDVVAGMLDGVPASVVKLAEAADRERVRGWAAALRDVAGEPGDRLLHWDLHFENVLAGAREPWLAIDPKPLAGDPGFELLPALHNRWAEIAAQTDVDRAIRRRFDLMVEVLGLDRDRAVAWTLGRTLQNALWDIEDGETVVNPVQAAIAAAITR
ncbi:streptomycin 6-kinase [Allocatelliglobosispora scoriae]|uniref:Streptomycin 6-kinase n=1 Tax=Allocatelliglobosispora scoriae TaxID=643052 RepID=A0A841BZD8_9ACTN|nr:aminoglycoside phosphotransferase family protein [Allocatelliglobosispora scoriae]MBB5872459.1 streptomycin 6-kinase [Allocatelliglobosispora scoriae]